MRVNWLKLLWLEILASSPTALWMLPLITAGGLLLLGNTQSDTVMRFEQIAIFVEIIIPLAVMFLSAGSILHEMEDGSLVFVAVRSSLSKLWLRRFSVLLLMSLFLLSILLVIYHFYYLPISIVQMLLASVSISLILAGISSAIALFLKEINAGYLIGIFIWSTCLIARRFAFDVLGPRLYLFYLWFGTREGIGTEQWIYNKLILSGVGLLFIGISAFWLLRTDRFST